VECGCFIGLLRLPQQVVLHEPWIAALDVLQRLPRVLDLLVIATQQLLLPLDLKYWSAKTICIVNDVVDAEVNICSAFTEIWVFITGRGAFVQPESLRFDRLKKPDVCLWVPSLTLDAWIVR
jgi:hypothetical protein